MPLDTKSKSWALRDCECFNQFIFGASLYTQTRGQTSNALAMQAVDHESAGLHDGRQMPVMSHLNSVRGTVLHIQIRVVGFPVIRIPGLIMHSLMKTAPECDIGFLKTAAYTQQGNASGHCATYQGKRPRVPHRIQRLAGIQ